MHKVIGDVESRVHPQCIVCGFNNSRGLHLNFTVTGKDSVEARFQCDKDLEGYPGMLHGGIISSILDGAMGHCMFARGQTAVTAEMTTKFRQSVLIGKTAVVSAKITRISHPLYLLYAEIVQSNEIKVTAKAKFYDRPDLINVLEPFA
jgi:uncharacterized protein (TIGR00369 family)